MLSSVTPSGDELLTLENLQLSRGGRSVLRDVSLAVRPGEIVGLLGARGAGKRAVLDVVVDELRAESGHIAWRGRDVTDRAARAHMPKRVASPLRQESRWRRLRDALFEPTLETLLSRSLALAHGRISRDDRIAVIEEALAHVGLEGRRHCKLRERSGGSVLRAQLARLFVQRPDLVVLDEPFKVWDGVTGQQGAAILEGFGTAAALRSCSPIAAGERCGFATAPTSWRMARS